VDGRTNASPRKSGPANAATEAPSRGAAIIAVVGPTASGKSALALALAERFGGEIVSTDSLQVYRYLDIGTAKPTREERERVPHHLIDVVEPDQTFSAGAYVEAARAVLADLERRGRVPILCGGTGLYFRALLRGIAAIPAIRKEVREAVQARAERDGLAAAYAELRRADPITAARLHPNDSQRILRALEVFHSSGRPLSGYVGEAPFGAAPGRLISVGIAWERALLIERINERVRAMLAGGWVDEVRGILKQGFRPELKPLQSIGYREIVEHLTDRRGAETLEAEIATRTRQYAKRQGTWFRADPSIVWAAPDQQRELMTRAETFLEQGGAARSPDPGGR
jgi:tRNA dimethylallyltransferase